MSRKVKTFLILVAIVCSLLAANVFLAAVDQFTSLLSRIHPVIGEIAFWTLLCAFGGLCLYGAMLYVSLPPPLKPPKTASGPEYDRYLLALAERLRANPKLYGQEFSSRDHVETALKSLSGDADRIIRDTATTVFLATALMQNGRLDGLVVFGTQIRMIWRLARLYFQRPSARHMLYLYMNVAVTALLSASLEDFDFAQIVAPFLHSLAPALPGLLPLGGISDLFVTCVSRGAANAFLTLRVGEVSRQYCESVCTPSRSAVRQSATAAALVHLRRIVRENSTLVVQAFKELISKTARGKWDKWRPWSRAVGGAAES
jgi:hypothetical protein